MHGHLVNQRQDLALLWLGKSALEALRTDAAYQSSKEDAQALTLTLIPILTPTPTLTLSLTLTLTRCARAWTRW